MADEINTAVSIPSEQVNSVVDEKKSSNTVIIVIVILVIIALGWFFLRGNGNTVSPVINQTEPKVEAVTNADVVAVDNAASAISTDSFSDNALDELG